MDWVIWTIGGIILIGVVVGIYRGALRIAVSIVTAILTVAITVFATPYVAQMVEEKTPLDDSIRNYVTDSMEDAAKTLLGIEDEEADAMGGDAESLIENEEIPRDIQIQAIESAELPDIFKNLLRENNNNEIYSEMGVETFAQYVGMYLSKLLIRVGTFVALFLIVTIVLRAIVFALNIVNEIPVFGLFNRLAGGVAGGTCSLLVVWVLFIIITLLYTTDIGKQMYDAILENDFTRILYENNLLLNMSIKI